MRKVVWESPVPAEAVLLAREAADVSETPREPAEPGVVDGCPARRRNPPCRLLPAGDFMHVFSFLPLPRVLV